MYVFSSFRKCSLLVAECLSEHGSWFHTVGADVCLLEAKQPGSSGIVVYLFTYRTRLLEPNWKTYTDKILWSMFHFLAC